MVYFKAQFQKDERKQCPLYSKYAKTLKINEVDMLTATKSEPDRIHMRNVLQIRNVSAESCVDRIKYTYDPSPPHIKKLYSTLEKFVVAYNTWDI